MGKFAASSPVKDDVTNRVSAEVVRQWPGGRIADEIFGAAIICQTQRTKKCLVYF